MAKYLVADATFGVVKSGPNVGSQYMVTKLVDPRDLDGSNTTSCVIFFGNHKFGNKKAEEYKELYAKEEPIYISGKIIRKELPFPCHRRLTTARNGQQVGEIAKDRITGEKAIYTSINIFCRLVFDDELNEWDFARGQDPDSVLQRILNSTISLNGQQVKLYERAVVKTADADHEDPITAELASNAEAKPAAEKTVVGHDLQGNPIYG